MTQSYDSKRDLRIASNGCICLAVSQMCWLLCLQLCTRARTLLNLVSENLSQERIAIADVGHCRLHVHLCPITSHTQQCKFCSSKLTTIAMLINLAVFSKDKRIS